MLNKIYEKALEAKREKDKVDLCVEMKICPKCGEQLFLEICPITGGYDYICSGCKETYYR